MSFNAKSNSSLFRSLGKLVCQLRRNKCDKPAVEGPSGVSNHPDGGHRTFRSLALFVALPVILILTVRAYVSKEDDAPREPFVPYEYLRRRTKRFPWGDGTKSLFHNDERNPLPGGYVDGYTEDPCDDD